MRACRSGLAALRQREAAGSDLWRRQPPTVTATATAIATTDTTPLFTYPS